MVTLSTLIRQKAKELGRKVKIICDYDEVLQGNKSFTFYKIYAKKQPQSTFDDFFKDYWKRSHITYKSYGNNVVTHLDVIENARTNDPEKFDQDFKEIKAAADFYQNAPWLLIAEELYNCLCEDLIDQLIFVSSYRKESYQIEGLPKLKKLDNSLHKFPQTRTELAAIEKDKFGKRKSARWKEIKRICPDFDIFIDDNPRIMTEVQEKFTSPTHLYILPKYKCNEHVKGIHVENGVSTLKDQDFVLGALEYRCRKLEQGLQELKEAKNRTNSFPFWLVPLGIIISLGLVLIILVARKKRK